MLFTCVAGLLSGVLNIFEGLVPRVGAGLKGPRRWKTAVFKVMSVPTEPAFAEGQ